MKDDQSVEATLSLVRQGRGKKIAYLVGAIIAVAIVIGAFVRGTRGTDVEKSSAAMVEAVPKDPAALDAGTVTVP